MLMIFNGGSSVARDASFTLVKEFTPATVPDADPVEFKVTGTPHATQTFGVTFTSVTKNKDGTLKGTDLAHTDIMVVGCAIVNNQVTDISPVGESKTVWQIGVAPHFGAKFISVTIKENAKTRSCGSDERWYTAIFYHHIDQHHGI